MRIPGTDAADSRRSADAALGPGKGKEKVAPSRSASKARSWSLSRGTETSSGDIATETLSEEIAPLERKRRLVHSDGSVVNGLPLPRQQASKKAATPQPDPKVATSIVLGGYGGGGSTTTIKEATVVVAATTAKKAAEAASAKEAAVVKKAAEAVATEEAT
jgi:hypothetical protein